MTYLSRADIYEETLMYRFLLVSAVIVLFSRYTHASVYCCSERRSLYLHYLLIAVHQRQIGAIVFCQLTVLRCVVDLLISRS